MKIVKLTDKLSVASQLDLEDVTEIAKAGFKTIINNRPDNEEPGQPKASEIGDAAARVGIDYYHQPVVSGQLQQNDVRTFAEHCNTVQAPVLAFCRTGTRCCILWVMSNSDDLDKAFAVAREAGYNLDHLHAQLVGR